jgi:UDP-glucose 4-epimerase
VSIYKRQLYGKRVLITGGLGMIGSTLAHKLVACGADVTIADACIEPYGANMFNIHGIGDSVHVNITDIRDRESIKVLVRDKDLIFNLAGQVSHNDSLENPFLDADINYIGHLNVLECLRKYNRDAKILFSGSRLQFGKVQYLPVDERHPLNPETPYAFNKTVAEAMYKYYFQRYGIRCVVFRIANPYGIRCQMKHSKYSVVNFFIHQAMEDKEITVYGDGEQTRDYIYVDDLAEAFLCAAANDKADGEVYNVGSGIGTKFKDMVQLIIGVVGQGTVRHVPWPETYVNVETGDYVTNIDKIHNTLGWSPSIPLSQGIGKTHEYYRQYSQYYFGKGNGQ